MVAQGINPVQPGAGHIPQPLAARRIEHHLARRRGQIQQGLRRIVQLHLVQGAVHIERARVGPAVFLNQAQVVRSCTGHKGTGRGQRQSLAGGVDGPAAACIAQSQRTVVIAQAIHRHARHRRERDGAGICLHQPIWRDAAAGSLQYRHIAQTLPRRQLGIADKQHHHAADKPGQHQQAGGDPGPAVQLVAQAPRPAAQRVQCGAHQ